MASDLWDGATANWNTAADWSLGVPTASSAVSVNSGDPQITSTVSIASMTVGSAGTVTVGAPLTVGSAGVTLNAGTLSLTAAEVFAFALKLAGAAKIINNGNTDYFNGVVSGGGSLNLSGAGTVWLDAADTYTGGTSVTGGAVAIQTSTSLGVTGALNLKSNAELEIAGNALTVANRINITGVSVIDVVATDSATISGIIYNGSGVGAIDVNGAGTLILSGANVFTGGTTVESGSTLSISAANNIGAASGTLTLAGGSTFDVTGASVDITNAVSLLGAASVSSTNGFSLTGLVSGSGSITVDGDLTLGDGVDSNNYTGGTTVASGGYLVVQNSGALGKGALNVGANAYVQFFDDNVQSQSATITNNITLSGDANLDVEFLDSATLTGNITDGASKGELATSAVGGDNTLILSGDNTYSGGTDVGDGTTLSISAADNIGLATLTLEGGSTLAITANNVDLTNAIVLNGAATLDATTNLTPNDQLTGAISGAGSITESNGGILSIGDGIDNNNYTGGTTVDDYSVINVIGDGALGLGTVTVENDAELWFDAASVSNVIALSGLAAFVVDDATTTLKGNIDDGLTKGELEVDGVASSDQLILSGDNTYSGGTEVYDVTLSISSGSNIGPGTLSLGLATLDLTADTATYGNLVTLYYANTIDVDFDYNSPDVFSGIVSGTGSLTVIGVGELELTNANTYSGGTTVDASRIAVYDDSALGMQGLALENGAFVDFGQSTVGNAITVAGENTLADSLFVYQGNVVTLNGVISDGASAGGVLVFGGGDLILTAVNTYSGGTEVQGGTTLSLSGVGTIGSGPLTLDNGSTFDMTTAQTLTNAISIAGTVALGASQYFEYLNGVISGAGALDISGGGFLILGGANNFTGGMTVTGTDVGYEGAGAFGTNKVALVNNSNLLFSLGAAFNVANAFSISGASNFYDYQGEVATLTGIISDGASAGAVTLDGGGGGEFAFTAANTYSGGTTIDDGFELSLGNVKALGSGGLTFAGASQLELAVTGTFANAITVDDNVSATFGAKTGVGATLTGVFSEADGATSTLHFGSSVDTGVVDLASTSATELSSGGLVSVDGGLLRVGSLGADDVVSDVDLTVGTLATTIAYLDIHGYSVGDLDLTGNAEGRIINDGAAATLVIDEDTNTAFAGIILNGSGVISLTVHDSYTLTLTGANTYTGATTIVGNATLQIGAGATGSIVSAVDDSGALVFDRSNAYTYAGVISEVGTVTQMGASTLTLSGANSYTGGTTIDAGEISLANVSALGSGGLTFAAAGQLELGVTGTYTNAITVDEGVSATFGAKAGVSATLTGVFSVPSDSSSTLHFGSSVDTGVVVLSPTSEAGNGFAGSVSVDGGTLKIGSTTADNLFQSVVTVGTLASTLATLDLDGQSLYGFNLAGNAEGRITDSGGAATLSATENASTNFAGVISDGAGVVYLLVQGTHTLTLTGANTNTGLTQVLGDATLQIGAGATGSIVSAVGDSGALVFDRSNAYTYAGVISEVGTVTQEGASTLTLTGANTYTGATDVNNGVLAIHTAGAIGYTSGVNVASGATLQLSGGMSTAVPLSLNGAGYASAGALQNLSGGNTASGAININGGATINDSAGTLTLSGPISGTGTLTFAGAGTTDVYGTIATNAVIKDGAGTVALLGDNTGLEAVVVADGVLAVNNGEAFGAHAGVSVASGGTLQLSDGMTTAAAMDLIGAGYSRAGALQNLSGSSTVSGPISIGSATTINDTAGSLTLSSAIEGSGALTFAGAGTTIVSGAIGTGANGVTIAATGGLSSSPAPTPTPEQPTSTPAHWSFRASFRYMQTTRSTFCSAPRSRISRPRKWAPCPARAHWRKMEYSTSAAAMRPPHLPEPSREPAAWPSKDPAI